MCASKHASIPSLCAKALLVLSFAPFAAVFVILYSEKGYFGKDGSIILFGVSKDVLRFDQPMVFWVDTGLNYP